MKNCTIVFLFLIINIGKTQSWQPLPSFTSNPIYNINFISKDTGYVIDDFLIKYKTNNGGVTWSTLSMPGVSLFRFLDRYHGLGYNFTPSFLPIIVYSSNSGSTWNTIYSDTINVTQSYCHINDSSIYLLRKNALLSMYSGDQDTSDLLFSSDYGSTWNIRSQIVNDGFSSFGIGTNKGNLNDLYFFDNNAIQKSSDGGFTWSTSYIFSSGYAGGGAFFYDNNIMYLLYDGFGGYMKTINGGSSWTAEFVPVSSIIYNLFFTSIDTGYAVGGDGFSACALYRTYDGGSTWQIAGSSSLAAYFVGIDFPVDSVGYASGGGGKIIKYQTNATSIENDNYSFGELHIFPNPASNYLQLSLDNWIKNEVGVVDVVDNSGRVLLSKNYYGSIIELDVSNLTTGYYILKVRSKLKSTSMSFVKK